MAYHKNDTFTLAKPRPRSASSAPKPLMARMIGRFPGPPSHFRIKLTKVLPEPFKWVRLLNDERPIALPAMAATLPLPLLRQERGLHHKDQNRCMNHAVHNRLQRSNRL